MKLFYVPLVQRPAWCLIALLGSLVLSTITLGQSTQQAESGMVRDSSMVPVRSDGGWSPEVFGADLSQVIKTKDHPGVEWVRVDPADEVWLVSARDFVDCNSCVELRCDQLISGNWCPAPLQSLIDVHANDKTRSTVIYVHGNRTNLEYAQSRGLQVYENLFGDAAQSCRPPVRWVIFAWRSESEILRVLPDFKIKWERSFQLGTLFCQFVEAFSDRDMVIAGFSLGSQVVLGGLSSQSCACEKPGQYRLAMISPALNPKYVCQQLEQVPQLPTVRRTAVFINRRDLPVKFAEQLCKKKCRKPVTTLADVATERSLSQNLVEVFDMTPEVSKKHSVVGYTADSQLLRCQILKMVRELQESAEPLPLGEVRISQTQPQAAAVVAKK